MTFVIDFIEQNWEKFLKYLEAMGIPKAECENYGNELLEKLKRGSK